MTARGIAGADLEVVREVLDPDVLTIGFARRFATYKRANLILTDDERLKRLLNHSSRPVQILFAGKAHPADDHGKAILQRVWKASREARFEGRIAFVEDGRIAEIGTHDELIAADGRYAHQLRAGELVLPG